MLLMLYISIYKYFHMGPPKAFFILVEVRQIGELSFCCFVVYILSLLLYIYTVLQLPKLILIKKVLYLGGCAVDDNIVFLDEKVVCCPRMIPQVLIFSDRPDRLSRGVLVPSQEKQSSSQHEKSCIYIYRKAYTEILFLMVTCSSSPLFIYIKHTERRYLVVYPSGMEGRHTKKQAIG